MAGNNADDTLRESPWAKQVEAAVTKAMAGVASKIVEEVLAVTAPRFDRFENELAALRQRVTDLEAAMRRRDTMPAPPEGA